MAEVKRITVELTEDEVRVISLAVDILAEMIDEGAIELEMSDERAYEMGVAVAGVLDTFGVEDDESDENDEDDEGECDEPLYVIVEE